MPVDENGTPPGYRDGQVNHAFLFPVAQADKIRACDDLKYGCVNPRYAERAPVSHPTSDHIGGMCLEIADTDKSWSFFKTDSESAYKNHSLTPDSAKMRLITFRNPADGLWYGFWPRALLFGDIGGSVSLRRLPPDSGSFGQ